MGDANQIRISNPQHSFFSLTHSFFVFESMRCGQEVHDTNRQSWLYRGTQGLLGLG
jgi:hypothetical protein